VKEEETLTSLTVHVSLVGARWLLYRRPNLEILRCSRDIWLCQYVELGRGCLLWHVNDIGLIIKGKSAIPIGDEGDSDALSFFVVSSLSSSCFLVDRSLVASHDRAVHNLSSFSSFVHLWIPSVWRKNCSAGARLLLL